MQTMTMQFSSAYQIGWTPGGFLGYNYPQLFPLNSLCLEIYIELGPSMVQTMIIQFISTYQIGWTSGGFVRLQSSITLPTLLRQFILNSAQLLANHVHGVLLCYFDWQYFPEFLWLQSFSPLATWEPLHGYLRWTWAKHGVNYAHADQFCLSLHTAAANRKRQFPFLVAQRQLLSTRAAGGSYGESCAYNNPRRGSCISLWGFDAWNIRVWINTYKQNSSHFSTPLHNYYSLGMRCFQFQVNIFFRHEQAHRHSSLRGERYDNYLRSKKKESHLFAFQSALPQSVLLEYIVYTSHINHFR